MTGHVQDIGAAVLGYIVMFIVAFVLFLGTWSLLGAEGSFKPGEWDVSTSWIVASIALGFVVSMSGGFATSKAGQSTRAVWFLVAMVVVVGIVQAIPEAGSLAPRPDGVSMFDAMSSLQQPRWLYAVNPIVGVAGVLLGARLAR